MKASLFRIFLFSSFFACNQSNSSDYVKNGKNELTWIDMATAGSIENKDNKLYMIDVYTDWCGWCKTMDKKTFGDSEVIKKLNENFHVVKFDAEMKQSLMFEGKVYESIAMGRNGVNKLAYDLLQGNLAYPSIVFLDRQRKPIQVVKGYKDAQQFLTILESIN